MIENTHTSPLSDEIGIFETRSKHLRFGAYAVLAAIIALVITGGVVFRFAEQITTSDLNGNVEKLIQTNTNEIDALNGEWTSLEAENEQSRNQVRDIIRQVFKEIPSPSGNASGAPISFDLIPITELTADSMAKMVSDFAHSHDGEPLRIGVSYFGQIGFFDLTKRQFNEVAQNLENTHLKLPTERLKVVKNREDEISKRIGFLQNVNQVLHARLVNIAAGLETPAAGDAVAKGNDGLYRLIQTNITRFGTLAVITFLIMILVPLYRYNMRLSAFYLARSDALRIRHSEILSNIGFEALTAALTPGIDFGKMPPTPTEQIINLFRSVSKSDEPH